MGRDDSNHTQAALASLNNNNKHVGVVFILTHKLVFHMLIGRFGNVLSLEDVSPEKSNE